MLHNISCIASRHIYNYTTLLWLQFFHPQNREYFADIHLFISHSSHSNIGTRVYQEITSRLPLLEPSTGKTREKTTDPEPMLCKTQIQAWRDSGGHCTARWLKVTLGCSGPLPIKFWKNCSKWPVPEPGFSCENCPCCNLHSNFLERCKLQSRLHYRPWNCLLDTHVSRELPTSPKTKRHTTGLSISPSHTATS